MAEEEFLPNRYNWILVDKYFKVIIWRGRFHPGRIF